MTYKQILDIAITQSAIDSGCDKADLESGKNTVVISKNDERARKYLSLPFILDITTYGNGVVASVSEEYYGIAEKYINSFAPYHLFETPNIHVLSEALRKKGADVCFVRCPDRDNDDNLAVLNRLLRAASFQVIDL